MKEIILNKKNKCINHRKYKTMVDDDLYNELNKFDWHIDGQGYSVRNLNGMNYQMHNQIMGAKEGFIVDHKDGNPLNNQKVNLRFATRQQNMFNKKSSKNSYSKFKGVSYHIGQKKFVAKAVLNKKSFWLGSFNSELEAAEAYNNFAIEHHGEFARLNKIEL